MLTLYDLLDIIGDDQKRLKWLMKYKIVTTCSECPSCGGVAEAYSHRGKQCMRCCNRPCRKIVSNASGGLLAGSHLSEKEFLLLAYFWAHDSAGLRSEHMLGHSSATVAAWSARFRQCVLNQQDASMYVLGGRDMDVEADETEVGMKQKGLHGHEKSVLADVRGVFELVSGEIHLEVFDKLCSYADERRFGPPNKAEADALFDHIASGSILLSDSAKAYIAPAKAHGLILRCVDHGHGEWVRKEHIRGKMRSVSIQWIDGTWGKLKMWLASKGGSYTDHVLGYLKEFQWRCNIGDADPFVTLCEHIRDGYFQ